MNSISRRHSFFAFSLALLSGFHAIHAMDKESYTVQKVHEANAKIAAFVKEMSEFAGSIDSQQIQSDKAKYGELDETQHRFLGLQLPLIKAAGCLDKLGVKLTVQTGAFTATDIVPAIIDRDTGALKGFCIIEREDKDKEGNLKQTYATIGGFHEYGLTFAENGAKEALEETKLNIPVSTMRLAGLFDDPMRDSRQHVASIAFTGASYDMPQRTAEARRVLVVTEDTLPEGPWFASDHLAIAKACIKTYKQLEPEILQALKDSVQ